jgi:hypothetical protein
MTAATEIAASAELPARARATAARMSIFPFATDW